MIEGGTRERIGENTTDEEKQTKQSETNSEDIKTVREYRTNRNEGKNRIGCVTHLVV